SPAYSLHGALEAHLEPPARQADFASPAVEPAVAQRPLRENGPVGPAPPEAPQIVLQVPVAIHRADKRWPRVSGATGIEVLLSAASGGIRSTLVTLLELLPGSLLQVVPVGPLHLTGSGLLPGMLYPIRSALVTLLHV